MFPDNKTAYTLIFSIRGINLFTQKRYERDNLKNAINFQIIIKKNSKTCQQRRG